MPGEVPKGGHEQPLIVIDENVEKAFLDESRYGNPGDIMVDAYGDVVVGNRRISRVYFDDLRDELGL